MTPRNPLGSFSALSLATNPAEVPIMATIAGVGVTIAAATITYKAYKDYQEKKDRNAIEKINALHQKHLEKIFIPGYNEIKGFPPIFKLTEDKDSSTADSLHFTDEQVADISKSIPHGNDIALVPYRQAIINSILKLQEYYFIRKNHHDITSGVISYLLYMLQTKCLSFQGYDYDIAYIKALSKFINEYATQFGEKSQHFSRLNAVYSYLQTAQQRLEDHKEKLSLKDILGELKDSCLTENDRLLRMFTQMITDNDSWSLIKTATQEELAEGILRKQYVHTEIKGLVLCKDNEVYITDSLLKPWLTELAEYFVEIMDPDTGAYNNDIKSPEKMFKYPDYNRLKVLEAISKPTDAEESELEKIQDDLENLKNLFGISKNFLTTQLDLRTKNKMPKFISITEDSELSNRARIIAKFATLIHQSISLQYLCTHLLKSAKQLGEIYIKNPNNFCRIFSILNELCKCIIASTEELKKEFTEIQRSSLNNMQIAEKELFPEQIKDILDSLHTKITNLGTQVVKYREKAANNIESIEMQAKSVKHEMFEVASLICDMYNICDALPARQLAAVSKKKVETPDALVTLINSRIAEIEKSEQPSSHETKKLKLFHSEIAAYRSLLETLLAMKVKSEALKSPSRHEKGRKLLELTTRLCNQTLAFLELSHNERIAHIKQLDLDVHNQALKENQFLDEQTNGMNKKLYATFHSSLFQTKSRRVYGKFSQTLDEIAKILSGYSQFSETIKATASA